MADIAAFLNKIRTAIYGEEVRSSIADAIEAVNEEGSSGGGGSGGGGGGSWTQVYEPPGDRHVTGDGIEYYNDGGTIYMHGHGNGFVFTNSSVSALLEILLTDRDIWFPVVIDNQYAAAGFMIRQGPYNRTVFGINATGISDGQHSVYFNFSYPKPAGFGSAEAATVEDGDVLSGG